MHEEGNKHSHPSLPTHKTSQVGKIAGSLNIKDGIGTPQTKLPEIAFKFKVQFISNGVKLKIEVLTHIDNSNKQRSVYETLCHENQSYYSKAALQASVGTLQPKSMCLAP